MVKQVVLGQVAIKIDSLKTFDEIMKILKKETPDSYDEDEIVYGMWMQHMHKIFVSKELSPLLKQQTLIHEIAEAMNDLGEFNFKSHDKILLLESFIMNLILNNRKLIKDIWKESDNATKDKSI
jgi:hypothetical protein